MLERAEELEQRVRETPLLERLVEARSRIGKMCSEGRPPRMTIPVQHDDDDFYISTTLADAQATIDDLQGQVEAARKKVEEMNAWVSAMSTANIATMTHTSEMQERALEAEQRVAQLEQERDAFESHAIDLQADHARVLGLVQAAVVRIEQVEGDLHAALNGTRHDPSWIRPIQLSRNERQELYLGCESQLKAIRQSLPAQPAQGGAASKPVTTCNRHSDCDAADEKARAKGALHADHCHDDCCSECFGN